MESCNLGADPKGVGRCCRALPVSSDVLELSDSCLIPPRCCPALQEGGFPRSRGYLVKNSRPATVALGPPGSNHLRSSVLMGKVNFKARAQYGNKNRPPGSLACALKLTWTHMYAHIHTSRVYIQVCRGDTHVHTNRVVQAGRTPSCKRQKCSSN